MDDGVRSHTVRQLVRDHYEIVYKFAYRLSGATSDAEDLTQQAFAIACRKLDQLRDPDRARSWLFTIVRRVYLKTLKETPSPFSTLETLPDPPDPGIHFQIPDHIDEEQLQAMLLELPEQYRTPLLLYYFDDRSYKEIAEQLEIPVGTVMSRLSRAKAFLKDRLAAPTACYPAGVPDSTD